MLVMPDDVRCMMSVSVVFTTTFAAVLDRLLCRMDDYRVIRTVLLVS